MHDEDESLTVKSDRIRSGDNPEQYFSDRIQKILERGPYEFKRERRYCDVTFDFLVVQHLIIECKVDLSRENFYKCLGQIIYYKALTQLTVWVVVPDDLEVKLSYLDVLKDHATVVAESALEGRIRNFKLFPKLDF